MRPSFTGGYSILLQSEESMNREGVVEETCLDELMYREQEYAIRFRDVCLRYHRAIRKYFE